MHFGDTFMRVPTAVAPFASVECAAAPLLCVTQSNGAAIQRKKRKRKSITTSCYSPMPSSLMPQARPQASLQFLPIIQHQPSRLLLCCFTTLFLMLFADCWRTTESQQYPQWPAHAGKNHLHGIKRLSPRAPLPIPSQSSSLIASEQSAEDSWEQHRLHLRHIPQPDEPQQKRRSPPPPPAATSSTLTSREQQQQKGAQSRVVFNGGGIPRPPMAQRVPVPLREAPSPVNVGTEERQLLAQMSSVEADVLAQRLLQEAGLENNDPQHHHQHQQHQQNRQSEEKQEAVAREVASTTPAAAAATIAIPPPPPKYATNNAKKETAAASAAAANGGNERLERIQSRWRKIGPLLRSNAASASLLPLRRLRLRRRKLNQHHHPVYRQRHSTTSPTTTATTTTSQMAMEITGEGTTEQQLYHLSTVERHDNDNNNQREGEGNSLAPTIVPMPTTTELTALASTTITQRPSSSSRTSTPFGVLVPRAKQLTAAAGGGRHRVGTGAGKRRQADENNPKFVRPAATNSPPAAAPVEFDFDSARQALLNAIQQKQQQQQQQQTPPQTEHKGWEPTLRMLRHRHRARLEKQSQLEQQRQQQQQQSSGHPRQRHPPIFNGPLLALPAAAAEQQNKQFGLRTETREGLEGNRLEEIDDNGGAAAAEKLEEQRQQLLLLERPALGEARSDSSRQPVYMERRFRLVPNKVVFRPRLKIRRPPGQRQQQPVNAAAAHGTDQHGASGGPIALPALGTFGGQQEQPAVPLPPAQPVPPVPPPPPPPPPPEPAPLTQSPPASMPMPPSPPAPPPEPLPALEVGSVGEQPPQVIPHGGPPPTSSSTAAAAETQPTHPTITTEGVVFGGEEQQPPALSAGDNNADNGLVGGASEFGALPPGFSPEAGSGLVGDSGTGFSGGGDDSGSGLSFGAELGTPPPGFKESFGLNGFETPLGPAASETTTTSSVPTTTTAAPTTVPTTTAPPLPVQPTPLPSSPPPPPPPPALPAAVPLAIEEIFQIPENSGLRPVAPPKEFLGTGGFGSIGNRGGGGGFGRGLGGSGIPRGGGGGIAPPPTPFEPVPPNVQVEPPPQPDIFTGESALTPNKRGPDSDGYGPSVLPGAAIPPASPEGHAIGVGGAAAGIPPAQPAPLPPYRPMAGGGGGVGIGSIGGGGGGAAAVEPIENEATTVKPSALLNIINKADEGFNQVITHFEQGTPLEAAAIDIMEVALGSQKLDSQAKLLSHVDRAFGLDNLQRLQRWANTGGAFDLLKEQFAKIAKNYKPPPETVNLFTVPPQFEYLFQSGSSGKKKRK